MVRRVKILCLVRMLVMMTMVCRPPERTPLGCAGTQNRKHKLPEAVGLEGLVGKIAMIEAGDGEHPDGKECRCKTDSKSAVSGKKYQQAGRMQQYERKNSESIECARTDVKLIRTGFRIEPSQDVRQPVMNSGHALIPVTNESLRLQ